MRTPANWCCALLAALSVACFSGYSEDAPQNQPRVRRGPFQNTITLSGELEASRGELLTVPPMPSWQTSIKWIVEDGATVKAGDPVAELDNTVLTADLDSKRQSEMQAAQELQQRENEWAAELEQKSLDVEKKKSDLDKARIEASIPSDLESARVHEQKQTALRRAVVEHEKALDVERSTRTAVEAQRRNLVLTIEKSRRDIAIAERAIEELVLRAPRDGIVVVRDHPWESGRKLQAGDPVWVGFPVAMLPDPASLRVKAALADVDDGKIAAGMPVTVTLDGYPNVEYGARIASVSAVAQESRRASLRRQFDVVIALDRLDPERMRPGLSAKAVVHRQKIANALLVPRAFASTLKQVKLGPCNAQDCVIVSGLEEGAALAR